MINPSFESAGDVHHIPEARDHQEFCGNLAIGGRSAIHEHGLVLIGQKLRKLAFDALERRVERTCDVAFRSAIVIGRTDIEDLLERQPQVM